MKTDSPEQPVTVDQKIHRLGQTNYYPPLSEVTSPTVSTGPAGYYLNRKDQTMRSWACFENGPIRPIRINGRLAWSVQAIKVSARPTQVDF
jgi:hypothetical protein